MNMTGVLYRHKTVGVLEPLPATPDVVSPSPSSPGAGSPSSWPPGHRMLVALLVVATVLSTVAAVIGFSAQNDGGAIERRLRDQTEAVTVERDDALANVETLDAELASLQEQLENAQAGNDQLTDTIERLENRITSVTEERDAAVALVATLTAERDAAFAETDDLTADLAALRERLADVIAERDELAKSFPVEFDAAPDPTGVVGRYKVKVSEVFGDAPSLTDLTISTTSEGYLRLAIPGFVEGGLFAADGALHLVADSATAIPACSGTARSARVVATVSPGSFEITATGATVTALHTVITVDAPATASCAASLSFFSAEVTPVG